MCEHNHNHSKINVNAILRIDPSYTTTLKNKFINDLTKRFKVIKTLIATSIYTNDCFGLKEGSTSLSIFRALPNNIYKFKTDSEKVTLFNSWLQEQIDNEILSSDTVYRNLSPQTTPWTNTYIDSAYKKGLRRGTTELRKAGYVLPPSATLTSTVGLALPISIDKAQLLYTRTFEELKGITNVMSQQISRVLSEGMLEGTNAATIARNINNRVDKIGITRARVLARTEIMRAHHVANIETYRQAKVEGVKILVEWSTGGNPCPICAELSGKIYTLDEISGEIPKHPNCRCVAVPRVVNPKTGELY